MSAHLEHALAALVAKHSDLTGREFVEACLRVAEGYFEPGDLPTLIDADALAAELRRQLA